MHFCWQQNDRALKSTSFSRTHHKATRLRVMVRNEKLLLSVAGGAALPSVTPEVDSSTRKLKSLFTQMLNKDHRFA